jgi:HK97 family phage portal protein
MGFGRLLKPRTEHRTAGAGFQVIIDGQPVNYPMSLYRGGMALPGAWRASLMISDALGSVPWDAWTEGADSRWTKVTPRPLILEQPNPAEERMNTFSSWGLDVVWHGNGIGLWADHDVDGMPTAVLPIPAEYVGVRRVGWETPSLLPVGSIEYQIAGKTYAPWEVFHIKGPSRPSDVRGFGVLEAHLSGMNGQYGGTLDLARELQRQAQTISQHGVPTGTLKSDNPDLKEGEAQDLKRSWLDAQRDRTVAVLNATTSFEPLSWNPDELQLVEARKMSLLETALVFGVQPSALGVETSNRTYRNDNGEDVKFTKWGLRGHLARFEAALTRALPPGMCARANLDDYTRPDPLTRAQTNALRITNKELTPNEARASEGLPPLPGGDEFPAPPPIAPADPPVDDPAPKEDPDDAPEDPEVDDDQA